MSRSAAAGDFPSCGTASADGFAVTSRPCFVLRCYCDRVNRRGFLSSIVAALAARFAPKPAYIRPLLFAPIPCSRPNVILTPAMITREAMMLLEKSLTFTKANQQQTARAFAVAGPKIGETLNLRIPPQFVNVPRSISEQKHIDVSFSNGELKLSIKDFQERVLAPQIRSLEDAAEARTNVIRDRHPYPLDFIAQA